MYIEVHGKASQSLVKKVEYNGEKMSLLDFLRSHDVPIASSCSGQGVCGKCILSNFVLSCQVQVKDYIDKSGNIVEVDYL